MARHNNQVAKRTRGRTVSYNRGYLKPAARTLWNNRKAIVQVGRAARTAYKAWGRKTTTAKRQKVDRDQLEISQHHDLSLKGLGTIMIGKQMNIKNIHGKFYYRHTNQRVLESGVGKQAYVEFGTIMSRDQIVGVTSQERTAFDRIDVDPLTLNPYVTSISPSSTYPGPFSEIVANDRFSLLKVNQTIQCLSMSTVTQIVDLYWVMPKTDCNIRIALAWENVNNSQNLTQGAITAAQTVATSTAVGGADFPDTWGNNPFQLKTLRKMYKSVRHQQFVLQPGDQRNFKVTLSYNKVYVRQNATDRPSSYWANNTVELFAVTRGGLVGIGAGEAPATEVTYGATKIGFVCHNDYVFGALSANRLTTNRRWTGVIADPVGQTIKQIDDTDDVDDIKVV